MVTCSSKPPQWFVALNTHSNLIASIVAETVSVIATVSAWLLLGKFFNVPPITLTFLVWLLPRVYLPCACHSSVVFLQFLCE